MDDQEQREDTSPEEGLSEIKLFVPEDLYRAFHRCVWIQVNEEDRSRFDIMREVVRDYLVKYGC